MSKESRKFKVPDEIATLYDFVNSLDLRHFVEHGVQHQPKDDLTSPSALADWMAERGLSKSGTAPSRKTFEEAFRLRGALRDYIKCDPAERDRRAAIHQSLSAALEPFSLRVADLGKKGMRLLPAQINAQPGISAVVAELYDGAKSGMLARLKMCAAKECQRVFFDRSKPGTRRWCQSALCGNRMKTRTYREKHKDERDMS